MAIFGWLNCLCPPNFSLKKVTAMKDLVKYILVQPPGCSRCRIQHFALLDSIQLVSAQPSNLSRHCERQNAKLYWNPKRWHQLASADNKVDDLVLKGNQVWQAGLPPHGLVLTVTNDCVVLQVFFNNSQNNLHNFTRHWSETDRPVVSRVVLLVLLENWDDFCQLAANWDLSRFPRPFKNHWEVSQ